MFAGGTNGTGAQRVTDVSANRTHSGLEPSNPRDLKSHLSLARHSSLQARKEQGGRELELIFIFPKA